jgi:Anti-sigma-K factor rskA/Putative zinc-finger
MSCDEFVELLEGYALGALEADERARVDAHLASCADCRALVAEYEAVLAGLPDALSLASPVRLPDALKTRLLRAIEAGASEKEREPGPAPPPRPMRRGSVVRRLLALAGASLLVLSLASNAALSLALDREHQLKERFAGLLDEREVVLEVVDGRGTERAFLQPPSEASTAYGKLFTNPELRDVVVMAGRLPKPAEGEAYRVWLTRGARNSFGGALKVNAKGFGLLVFEAARSGPRYDAARVVLQRNGTKTPAGETVLAWSRTG